MNVRHLLLVVAGMLVMATPATAQYPWPVEPRHETHEITGTFAEHRGPANPHFHSGVDMPKADGSPVYAVASGSVVSLTRTGANAYVRVGDYAYVHVVPDPALAVGDAVDEGDVVGTIVSGQGHVHFIDGQPGSEREPLIEGRLTPYHDPWPPAFDRSSVQFHLMATRQRLASSELTGTVEVSVRVQERNAAAGRPSNRRNNGIHSLGYRVLSADRQTVVHSPSSDGVVYDFDLLPDDRYVHNVFNHRRGASTSDQIYLATNQVTRRVGWDTGGLDGGYTLMLFAADARGNADTFYVDVGVSQRDIVPPPPPTLLAVTLDEDRATFLWTGGEADDLAGYRIRRADEPVQPLDLLQGEGVLADTARTYTHDAALETATYFAVHAVDGAEPVNVSTPSDVYGGAPDGHGARLLIVDGFDRRDGSWSRAWHPFAGVMGRALAANGFGFTTAANEAVEQNLIDLSDHDAVFWGLGDESTDEETFSTAEQDLLAAYLEQGGRLFVSGSEVAWDLDEEGTSSDRAFLRRYLKVEYAGDDAASIEVRGTAGSAFDGLSFQYGGGPGAYLEDYPDFYRPVEGGTAAMRYEHDEDRVAAVQYAGSFGDSDTEGRVVVMGLPFETIHSPTWQAELIGGLLQFLLPETTNASREPERTGVVSLHNPYPNPTRGRVTCTFSLPHPARARLDVFDLLGRHVATLADAFYPAGTHETTWQSSSVGAGAYVLRLRADGHDATRRVVTIP